MGDERRDSIIVAEPNFIISDGIVLIDNGHDAHLKKTLQRAAGVQILGAVKKVVGHQEDLTAHEPVDVERIVPDPHETTLPYGAGHLLREHIFGPLHLQSFQARGDCSRRNQYDAVPLVSKR